MPDPQYTSFEEAIRRLAQLFGFDGAVDDLVVRPGDDTRIEPIPNAKLGERPVMQNLAVSHQAAPAETLDRITQALGYDPRRRPSERRRTTSAAPAPVDTTKQRPFIQAPPSAPGGPLPKGASPSFFEQLMAGLGGVTGLPMSSAEDYSTPEGQQAQQKAEGAGQMLGMLPQLAAPLAAAVGPLLKYHMLQGEAHNLSKPVVDLLSGGSTMGATEFGAPSLQRIEQSVLHGDTLPPANWADTAPLKAAIGDLTIGGETVPADTAMLRYSRGFGAMSPTARVPQNTEDAATLLSLHQQQFPFTKQELYDELRSRPGTYNVTSKMDNAARAYRDEPLGSYKALKSKGGGPEPGKAESMAQLSVGKDYLPFETHVLATVGADTDVLDKQLPLVKRWLMEKYGMKEPPSDSVAYYFLEDALRNSIVRVVGKNSYDPPNSFAQMWEGTRGLKEEPYTGGHLDLLKEWGLLDPGAMGSWQNIERVLGTPRNQRQFLPAFDPSAPYVQAPTREEVLRLTQPAYGRGIAAPSGNELTYRRAFGKRPSVYDQ